MWNTPIQQLNKNLYIKREDTIPFSFGGNKARKAQLFLQRLIGESMTALSHTVAAVLTIAV